jgi:hypothetical protein
LGVSHGNTPLVPGGGEGGFPVRWREPDNREHRIRIGCGTPHVAIWDPRSVVVGQFTDPVPDRWPD